VPITAIERSPEPFQHFFIDCAGKLLPHLNVDYNYCLIVVCSFSRFPFAVPLRSLTAKNVCDALLSIFAVTGLSSNVTVLSSDNGSEFSAALTRECMSRIGVSPRYITPLHPNANGLAERYVGTIKQMVSRLASENPRQWTKYLPFVLWALREVPNETIGLPPSTLVFGRQTRGPLSILKETWEGNRELPPHCKKSVEEYLYELKEKLETAKSYADKHANAAQKRYVDQYNLRSRDKRFSVGESVLILQPDSTSSKAFSKWKGPAKIVEIKSDYSYMVEIDNAIYHIHANRLRKYNVRVDEVNCAYASLPVVESGMVNECNCAVIYERDTDFGNIEVVNPPGEQMYNSELLPSQRVSEEQVNHLAPWQRKQLFAVLDKYAMCFSESPGLCNVIQHEIPVTADFKPKRLPAYRVPENLKESVNTQIKQLLDLGIIKPSKSPMSSPVVCVIKGQKPIDGKITPDKVRICVNYQYVNKFTVPDVLPLPNISEVIQRVGNAKFISLFDARSGYHQLPVKFDDQWLTGFVCDLGFFEFTRCPFGMRSSGASFVRAIHEIINPIREFVEAYVDDMAVYSDDWTKHLNHINEYLLHIKNSGLTLNLSKCEFAKPEIKYVGHIVGSGKRLPDPEKVEAVMNLKVPESKKQVRQIMGLFSHFRDYIPLFSEVAKPITDLTLKRVPSRVPWGREQQNSFDDLKHLLCRAVQQPLSIIVPGRPFCLYVDASDYAVGCVLGQCDVTGKEQPVAFASSKFTTTQCNWATIEKEAYACIWALQKYRHWLFGSVTTLYSDHNPLTYLSESSPKSAKLMRWALALQEFNILFRYRAGRLNQAADCVSRMVSLDELQSSQ
jgi:hypothetical protein